jgi:D-inositol-3-phosphate glycosyltransferase
MGDGGGMNVYVKELAQSLARKGVDCDVFTRSTSPLDPLTVEVEPGFKVHHVVVGPRRPVSKNQLFELTSSFAEKVLDILDSTSRLRSPFGMGYRIDAVHGNYWLSSLVSAKVSKAMDVPLFTTFHTLTRVKAEASREFLVDDPMNREAAEEYLTDRSDAIFASCTVEATQLVKLYNANPSKVHVISPGVDHALFGPGERRMARSAVRLPQDVPVILFVGRIQHLKGADLAVATLAELESFPSARLIIIGGPSGSLGREELHKLRVQANELGIADRVHFLPPQPHELLSTYYRAANICLAPSRVESFGLVALEAAACGLPVVASKVGGLSTLVEHGITGFLVDSFSPGDLARAVSEILSDTTLATRMARRSISLARRYSWSNTASKVIDVYARIANELDADSVAAC